MKKILCFFMIFSILFTMPVISISADAPSAQSTDYVHVEGENLLYAGFDFAFNNNYYVNGIDRNGNTAVLPKTELGTTRNYNICPPQDGVTMLIVFRQDCHNYVNSRAFFQSLSRVSWLDDPRLRIMAIDCTGEDGGYPLPTDVFANTYAAGCKDSIEWYGAEYLLQWEWMNKLENISGLKLPYVASPLVMLFSNGEMLDSVGTTIPSYRLDYFGYDDLMKTVDALEETITYVFPDMADAVEPYSAPTDETWTVSIQGERDYEAIQESYLKLMDIRKNRFPEDDMILDAALTECAMQRAAEIALSFSHTRPDGRNCLSVCNDLNYDLENGGENIHYNAMPSTNVDTAMDGWWNSEGHRNNMLDYTWNRVGVGCFKLGELSFWVQLFDSSADDGDPLCERYDQVITTSPVKTTTDKLNLKVRKVIYSEVEKDYSYVISHMFGPSFLSNLCPIVPYEFDETAKASDNTTVADVSFADNGYALNIKTKNTNSGVMQLKIAPEQNEPVYINITGTPAHTHGFTNWGRWKYSNCTEGGFDRRYCHCGYYEESDLYPIQHEPKVDPGKEATCSTTGLTEGSSCKICYAVIVPQEVIPTLPHDEFVFSKGTATCQKSGLLDGKQCLVCGLMTQKPVYVEVGPHIEVVVPGTPATDTTTGLTDGIKCSVCGLVIQEQEVIPALDLSAPTQVTSAIATIPSSSQTETTEPSTEPSSNETEPSVPTDPSNPSDPSEPEDPSEIETTEPITEPSSNEPEPSIPTDPSNPSDPSEPVDPSEIETTEPSTEPSSAEPEPTESSTSTTKPTTKPTTAPMQTVCVHSTVVKNFSQATYFTTGYTGDKYCVKCNKMVSKGSVVAKVYLKTPKIKLTKGKKQFKVKYNPVEIATGFQVRFRIKGKWKARTFETVTTVTKTIKKLKKGKYRVQVRAISVIGNMKAYSKWTKAKKVTVK